MGFCPTHNDVRITKTNFMGFSRETYACHRCEKDYELEYESKKKEIEGLSATSDNQEQIELLTKELQELEALRIKEHTYLETILTNLEEEKAQRITAERELEAHKSSKEAMLKEIYQTADYDYLFRILIVGNGYVGKSCLLLRFADDHFDQGTIYTIGVDFKMRNVTTTTDQVVKLQVWDSAGTERFRTVTGSYYRGAHAVMITYDITDRMSFHHMPHWHRECVRYAPEHCKFMIVGTKSDLEDKRVVSTDEGQQYADDINALFSETSALTGDNVDSTFIMLATELCKARNKLKGTEGRRDTISLKGQAEKTKPSLFRC